MKGNTMNLEQFGVTLACDHAAPISITTESVAGLVLTLHLHRESLAKANEVLRVENPTGANERLSAVQASLIGMAGALDNVLSELLRVGREQGLQLHSIGNVPHH
jgi:hypothetical protein